MTTPRQIGKYRILDEIASGAQGAVYRGFDPSTSTTVAIKVLHQQHSGNESFVERFRREASLIQSIDHENIIRILDVGRADGREFMAMEFIPETLSNLIEATGAFLVDQAVALTIGISEGIGQAHAQGIVHRDIKPQNVLITPDGIPKVTDFGIARGEMLSTMTATGVMMGTPFYMSPEQVNGERGNSRSDVYSLGCLLYQLLAGEVPFTGDTPLAILRRHVDDQPPSLTTKVSGIPDAVVGCMEKAMSKDPDQRFADGTAFSSALREALPSAVSNIPEHVDEDPVTSDPVESDQSSTESPGKHEPDAEIGDESIPDLEPDIEVEEKTPPVDSGAATSMDDGPPRSSGGTDSSSGDKSSESIIPLVIWVAGLLIVGLFVLLASNSDSSDSKTSRVPPTAIPTVIPTVIPTWIAPTSTPTAVPPTAVPPTAVPPTAVPPTAVPPTAVPTPFPTIARFGEFEKSDLSIIKSSGPSNVSLVHAPETYGILHQSSGVNILDFETRAIFFNPYSHTEGNWDYGFQIRKQGQQTYDAVIIDSRGGWAHYAANGAPPEEISSGAVSNLKLGVREKNEIHLIAVYDKAWLFVNGILTATLNMGGRPNPGDISTISGFSENSQIAGAVTEIQEFSVLPLVILTSPNDFLLESEPFTKAFSNTFNAVRSSVTTGVFTNPDQDQWSYGFIVAYTNTEKFEYVMVSSNGLWYHYSNNPLDNKEVLVTSGSTDALNLDPRSLNDLELVISRGMDAWLLVNGDFVSQLKLATSPDLGLVSAFRSFFEGDSTESVAVSKYAMWGGAPTPDLSSYLSDWQWPKGRDWLPEYTPGVLHLPAGVTGMVGNPLNDGLAIGPDGRYVSYLAVGNIVSPDLGGHLYAFVYDRTAASLRVLGYSCSQCVWVNMTTSSMAIGGTDSDSLLIFDTDGQVAALKPGEYPSGRHIYARATGEITFLKGSGSAISGDGKWIAFTADGDELGELQHDQHDVILENWETGEWEIISKASVPGSSGTSHDPSISNDGNIIAYWSTATDLDGEPDGENAHVYVYERLSDRTKLISVSSNGETGNDWSSDSSVSGDGSWVVFGSWASNLVADDDNGTSDIFIYNTDSGTLRAISVTDDGMLGNGASQTPDISADGRYVVFASTSSDLTKDDGNESQDVFVRDLTTGTTLRVEIAESVDGNYGSGPAISEDGRFIAFWSGGPISKEPESQGTLLGTNVEDVFVVDNPFLSDR